MRRMYGAFEMLTEYGLPLPNGKRKRDTSSFHNSTMPPGVPDLIGPPEDIINDHTSGSGASFFGENRSKRQTDPNEFVRNSNQRTTNGPAKPTIALNPSMQPNTGRLVSCGYIETYILTKTFYFIFV